jgi:hypothetical protein
MVPEIKRIPKVEFGVKCEEVCVPGKSRFLGLACTTDCEGNCCRQPAFEPNCGKVYVRRTPVKHTTYAEQCTYKCVVEYVCGRCGCCAR